MDVALRNNLKDSIVDIAEKYGLVFSQKMLFLDTVSI
jgi:hypothetical protein